MLTDKQRYITYEWGVTVCLTRDGDRDTVGRHAGPVQLLAEPRHDVGLQAGDRTPARAAAGAPQRRRGGRRCTGGGVMTRDSTWALWYSYWGT